MQEVERGSGGKPDQAAAALVEPAPGQRPQEPWGDAVQVEAQEVLRLLDTIAALETRLALARLAKGGQRGAARRRPVVDLAEDA
jgi:hypothetical protein